jgi:hypothetical protein
MEYIFNEKTTPILVVKIFLHTKGNVYICMRVAYIYIYLFIYLFICVCECAYMYFGLFTKYRKWKIYTYFTVQDTEPT